MDVLPSAEFRKRYASLDQPTRVTVNGHVIGVWTPARHDPWAAALEDPAFVEAIKKGQADIEAGRVVPLRSFGTPRPAPKTRSR